MARTPARVSQDIIANLNTTLPGLSLEIGTPERKIIDAVGEAVAEGYLDQYVTGTTLDIDTKAGLELEQFVGIFGFGRLQGRKATGMVHVEMSVPAAQDIQFPASSQFFFRSEGDGGTPLFFYSTQPAVLVAGTNSVDIPVECTVAGTIGNVPPGTISSTSAAIGSTSVTNLTPMTGGVDVETDDDLRQRFKNTFLRNIAGTEDFYRSLCIANYHVSKVAIYGPTTMYRTQVAVPSGSVVLPVHQDVKYVWPETQSVFKNLAQPGEVFYTPGGVDYTWGSGSQATLTRNASGAMVAGEIVDVEFEYTTRSSRNVPASGILNKIDIFVDGLDPLSVSEKSVVSNTLFSNTTTDPLYVNNFVRVGIGTAPSASNRFMRLGSVPVVAFPNTLVIKDPSSSVTTTYTRGTHYHLVQGTTLVAGSEREIAGIEWLPAPTGPANGTPVTVTYSYNRVPELLNAMIKNAKQITTDVLVHQAEWRYLRVYLDVEYDRGISIEQANANIQTALRAFFGSMQFGSWVEMSDIAAVVHAVVGVDNVVVTPSANNATDYGVKVYNTADAVNPLSTNAIDFKLNDNQLPAFLDAVITRKANR
ncbi:baseplate J protein [Gordonia phage RedWattleHog]|uniref:Baseplate J protein n=1 Tax=Gordonia phage Stormageddon TaxID=2656541 RepID=A0A649VRT9_9CAUD|nr:baseplate wedge subunit [Gordonia phage Stormageddon]QGJ94914.1 baseplate J protein [Gordonia phage Stormageddon]QLF83558.1 baseplate J protein [Gordonia phage RedWattleHog]